MFKFIKKILFSIIFVLMIACGIIGYQGYDMYKTAIAETSIKEKVEDKDDISIVTIGLRCQSYLKRYKIPCIKQYSDIKDRDLSIKKNELPIYIESIYLN